MTNKSHATILLQAWEEKWSPKRWVREVHNVQEDLQEDEKFISSDSETLSDLVTKYTFTGAEPNQYYLSCLQEGLKAQILSSVAVLDSITKISTWDRPKTFSTVVSIIKDTLNFPSADETKGEMLHLPRALARAVFWLLCHTAEALKACYKGLKEPEESGRLQEYFETLQGAQELLSDILDKEKLRDLVLIGKLGVEGDADMVQLQMHLKALMNIQNEGFIGSQDSTFLQELVKDLFKTATRYLNMTSLIMSHERKPGHIPSKLLQYFIQFQVANDFSRGSQVYSDLLDIILRSENIPLDQLYVDLMRCSCHGILNAATQEELFRWVSFFLFKVPSIFDILQRKYKQTIGDNTIYFSACKQFVQFNTLLDDVDVKCRCRLFNIFLAQCKAHDILDMVKTEVVVGLRKTAVTEVAEGNPMADSFPVGVVLHTTRTLTDLLKVLNSPLETHRDMIRQQLGSLSKAQDLGRMVSLAASTDQYVHLVQSFVRLNEKTKHPMDSSEDQNTAEIRCEIFNLSFVILFYITTTYGTRVLDEIESDSAFFVTWRKSCTSGIGERKFSQTSMDTLLDQVSVPLHVPSAQMAKWDEHCLCAGEVIRELAQAVGCRVINIDVFQRICEGFMNKRPALCIAASVWLLTQYKSLNIFDKDKTSRILKHFKRAPTQQQTKIELVSKSLEKHTLPYGLDAVAPSQDNTDDLNFTPQKVAMFKKHLQSLAAKDSGLLFDASTIEELKKHHQALGSINFTENLVKVVLDCGYVEKSILYGNIACIITLLDAEALIPDLFRHVMLDIVRHKNGTQLLADPRGRIVANFLGLALAFYQAIPVPTKRDRLGYFRPSKVPRLDISSTSVFQSHVEAERQTQPFVDFLTALMMELSTSETCSLHHFLASLLESVAVTTAHLPRFLTLTDDMIQTLFALLPSQLPREIILLICDVTTSAGRQHAARPLVANFLASS